MPEVIRLDIRELNEDWHSDELIRQNRALRALAHALCCCLPSARWDVAKQLEGKIDETLFEEAVSYGRLYIHLEPF